MAFMGILFVALLFVIISLIIYIMVWFILLGLYLLSRCIQKRGNVGLGSILRILSKVSIVLYTLFTLYLIIGYNITPTEYISTDNAEITQSSNSDLYLKNYLKYGNVVGLSDMITEDYILDDINYFRYYLEFQVSYKLFDEECNSIDEVIEILDILYGAGHALEGDLYYESSPTLAFLCVQYIVSDDDVDTDDITLIKHIEGYGVDFSIENSSGRTFSDSLAYYTDLYFIELTPEYYELMTY